MLYFDPSNRLRLASSMLCMLMALLVLVWGSAFKASLYHTCGDLAHIPTAKLLTDHERPSHAEAVAVAKAEFPPAAQAPGFIPAFVLASPRHALVPLLPVPAQPAWILSTQGAARSNYFHRPPPRL